MLGIEWPSEHKLERLRQEGRVPWSRLGASCLLLAVFILLIKDFGVVWQRIIKDWQSVWLLPDSQAGFLQEKFGGIAENLNWIFSVSALVVLGLFFAVGLVQTKFFFRPGLIALRLDRLNGFGSYGSSVVGRVIGALVLWCSSLLIGFLCLAGALPFVLSLLERKPAGFVSWPGSFFEQATPLLLMVLGLVALAGVVSARFLFLYRHRMTPAELDLERREGG